MMPKKSEKDWEAEQDVDTLIRAKEILGDESRKKRALVEIERRDVATDEAKKQLQAKTSKRLKKAFGKK